jgi:cold shock CspA family protein
MFDPARGFGFIAGTDGREVYFHVTGIESTSPLKVGAAVKFVQGFARDGRTRARSVAVLQSVGSRN